MEIFEYSFMVRAFLAGILIAVLAPSLGLFVVVRRYSMLSDALAHVSLLGVAFGFLFTVSSIWSAIIVTLVFSWAIEYLRQNHKIYSDSILSIFLSGSLALSIIIVSMSNSFNSSLFDYLFGSIVSVTDEDIYAIAMFGLACLMALAYFYKKLIFASFDEESAKASGINTAGLNYLLVSLTAITIGLSIKIVGALLIGALMIIPVVSAMQYDKGFIITALIAVVISVLSVVIGLFVSYYFSMPSGATIVVVAILFFIVSLVISKIKN